MLCIRWRSLFQGRSQLGARGRHGQFSRKGSHHVTSLTFKDSVQEGCRICIEIWRKISHLSWSEFLTIPLSTTGFTTYRIANFGVEEPHGSIAFRLGFERDEEKLLLDSATTILRVHFRPDSIIGTVTFARPPDALGAYFEKGFKDPVSSTMNMIPTLVQSKA
jgi:hypothetical protein